MTPRPVPQTPSDPEPLLVQACRRQPTPRTPIWLMRQAGRYMPEYRAIRSRVPFLDLCKTPELAAQVTLDAATILDVDAAILFADILLPLEPLGFHLEFAKGEGPVIHNPVRAPADLDRITPLTSHEPLDYVCQTLRLVRAALPPDKALIGFAGAPFTLACYLIEGHGSRQFDTPRAFLLAQPEAFHALMALLTDATILYLNAQIAAGAQIVQLFDSWVGTLPPHLYRATVLPHMKRLFAALPEQIPAIHFGTGTATLLELQREAGGHVLGLDWRTPLGETWDQLGPDVAIQGNLDPAALLATPVVVRTEAHRILKEANGRPGHIFNLGHGILPSTPPSHVHHLIETVRSFDSSKE